jgi:hypothetical protein
MILGPKTRRQSIGLRPMGSTITVELASDNPFESNRDVEVYTQVSGGIAGADPHMRSRGVLTPVMADHNGLFAVSGLGEGEAVAAPAADPAVPAGPSFGQQLAQTGLTAALGIAQGFGQSMVAKQNAKAANLAAEGQARILSAQAAAERAAAMRAQAEAARLEANKKPFPLVPVLIGAGVLVALIGGILILKK